ncbi:phage protein NinX family protein [Pantoea eucrina]|nr:phage protein NinX family protein [Pantoea eucrina]
MNYSEMTDFEINCAVARAMGMSHAFFFSKSEGDFCEGIEPSDRGPIWQSEKHMVNGYRVSNGNCFNPCNSWADAGPIIEKERITIAFDGSEWVADSDAYFVDGAEWQISGETNRNPLRAAMIAFLMMQEASNV